MNSEKVNIKLSNAILTGMRLEPLFPMSKYLKWTLDAKAIKGTLTIGELEIPLECISLEAQVNREDVDETTLKKMFPEAYK